MVAFTRERIELPTPSLVRQQDVIKAMFMAFNNNRCCGLRCSLVLQFRSHHVLFCNIERFANGLDTLPIGIFKAGYLIALSWFEIRSLSENVCFSF